MISAPHHWKIQRRLGWVILVAGITIAILNLFSGAADGDLLGSDKTNLFNAISVALLSFILFSLSRINHWVTRLTQVILFGIAGLLAMYNQGAADMTGMMFCIYAIFLAIQYSFFQTHFIRKLIIIVIVIIGANVAFMAIQGTLKFGAALAGAAFIIFYLLLLWIAFAETLQTYIDRTKELELERQKDSVFVRFGKNTAGLVHNLRNMLSVAYGFNEMLSGEVESEHLKSLIARERAAYDRMSGTITRTLAIVKAKQDTSTKAIDLNELIAGLIDFLNTDLELKRGVKINLDLATEKLIVNVQPLELCEVIENIIRNSWEAMVALESNRMNEITIKSFQEAVPGFVISDNGPGIQDFTVCANDECRKFFSIGKTTKEGGTGLGVPFILEAAKSNGWYISISRSPEGGIETKILFFDNPKAD